MLHATFQIIIFVIAATFHPIINVKRTETNKTKDMKLRLKIFTLISVLTLFFCTPGAMARHGKALEVAREIKEQTDRSVDSLQSTIGSLNTDSLGEKVIYEAPADKDTDDDNDDSALFSAALLIPIIAIIFGTAIPAATLVLIVFFICQSSRQKARDKNDVIRRAVEAHYPLPPGFYKSDAPLYRLQSGIGWIGWGLGITLLYIFGLGTIWLPLGIILSFIGLSRLAVYFVTRRDWEKKDISEPNSDAEQN